MGTDKAFADLGGQPMIAHAIARLRAQLSALAINANGDVARYAPFGLPVLPDPVGGFIGPLAGLLAALRWGAEVNAPLVVTAPADTPFLPLDLVARLHAGIGTAEIAVARAHGTIHPTIALWSASLAEDLANWVRDEAHRAVHEWIATRRSVPIDFPDDEGGDPFFNVNTPAELDIARDRAQRVRVG
jgi:molybdopterin-guanine dinucleotide biosynthesis protein A